MKIKQDKPKVSIPFKEQFINSILQLYYYAPMNKSVLFAFYILGLLQPLLFQNFPLNSFTQMDGQILTPINQFWYIEVVARPDFIVSGYIPKYCYLISMIFSMLFIFIPLLLNISNKQNSNNKRMINKLSFYMHLSSNLFQLQPIFLQIPLQCLCFQSLSYNLSTNGIIELNYLNITLITTTLLFLYTINFLIILLCKETIDFNLNCFSTLKLSFGDFIIWMLNIFQIIIYYHLTKFNEVLQGIILFAIALIMLYNIFSLLTCLKKVILTTLMVISYQSIQSLLILVNFQSDIDTNINIIIYILVPLLAQILYDFFVYKDQRMMQKTQKFSISNCKYILGKFFNDEFISFSQTILTYSKIISEYQHKKQSIEPQLSLPLTYINKEYLPKYLSNFYFKSLMKKYIRELQRVDSKNRNANHYVHYVSLLYRIGLNNLALKQINILLFNISMRTNSRSQVKEKISEQIKSNNTINQGRQSMSRSSKSQDVQEAGQLQINKLNKMLAFTGTHLLNFYQKVRVMILREKVRDKLKLSFQYKEMIGDTYSLQMAIEIFLKSEKRNQNLKEQVQMLVNSKLGFFLQLQQVKHIRSAQLFQVSKSLSKKIEILENKLIKLYKYFPSQRIQSLHTYFQGELLENYLYAHKITCNSSISDEKLINVHSNAQQKHALFNKDLIYMNVKLFEDTQELQIQNITPQICKFFLKDYDDLKTNSNIDYLLPDGIINEHQLLVQRFLQTSQSRYYLNKNLSFFKLHKIIIQPFEFFFEVNFSDITQIQFLVFLSESFQTSAYIFVDVNQQVGGITQNLLDKLGYSNYYIENIRYKLLLNTPIEYLIPCFQQLITYKDLVNLADFKFIKQPILINPLIDDKVRNTKQDFSEWQLQQNLMYCECLMSIHIRELYGYQYYIVEIKELKVNDSYFDNEFESNSLDQAFTPVSDQEGFANPPGILKIEREKFEPFRRNDHQFETNLILDKSQQFYHPDQQKYEVNLMSPVDLSANPTPLNSANPLLKQQEFYSQIAQNPEGISYSSKNQFGRAVDMDDLEQVKKPQFEKKGEDTNSSQVAWAKQSQFYKKYEMIQQILRPHIPRQLRIFTILLVVYFMISCIHYIIIITKNQNDLNQFISEIDMIELHSSFMAPHDIFVAMRVAILSYNAYVSPGALTQAQANALTKPFYDNIQIGFNEIKEVFIKQLNNQNLQPFFENKTIGMIFMGANTSDVYNQTLNIREALQQIIQNLHQYKYRYENRMSTAGSSIQVFGVANQFFLHYWLEELTLEIMDYSTNRSITIESDWTMIWAIFVVITLLVTLCIVYYFRLFNQRQDMYLGVFKFCNLSRLQYEIDRYKLIQKQLLKNPDLVFLYKFDLSQKEQQLLIQQKVQDQLNRKNKDQQRNGQLQYEPLSIIMSISLILGIWIVFLGLSVIIFQGELSYLKKYPDTVDIYKLIQDMTYSSATLYQNRDYHFIFPNFTYLTEFDSQQIFSLIDQGIDNIVKFNLLTQEFDSSKYQVNNDFVFFFNQVQKQSICDILSQEQLGFLVDFCPISIQGNYLKGVVAALNFIKNQIQTQIVVNKFSTRVEYPIYDNEAGIIMVRVFQMMTQKLKSSMLGVTNELQTVSIVLSSIYLIFAVLSISVIFLGLKKYLETEFNTIKRFVQLIPSSITMLDDQFERYIRALLVEEIS
ncbi:unnamed protein product [Paramecium octaurelia]|uniref:Transmembrane protein n=1 Tax=Paramecium octaurelia TaxID=43137 RepID=A0A8S1Y8P6_PAROT|nr:unnamed protein product [Paramecium octaurelia]